MTLKGYIIYAVVSFVAFLLGKILVGLYEHYRMYKVKQALAAMIESGEFDKLMEQLITLSEEEEKQD